jgi:hypothetical protein
MIVDQRLSAAVIGVLARQLPDRSGANRNALNFEHDVRSGKAGNGNGCARREVLAKQLCPQFSHSGGVANIDKKHGHGDDIGQLTSTLSQRLFDITEGLGELRVEIAGQRTAVFRGSSRMTRDPYDGLLTLRDDSR